MSLYDYDVGCPSCDYGLPINCTCAPDFPCRDGEGDVCGECEACLEGAS